MKKTFSILLALALVLSFSVVAVPAGTAGAATTLNVVPFTLAATPTATAVWTNADAKTGSYSVKLTTTDVVGHTASARMTAYTGTIDSITSLSFWYKHVTFPGKCGPRINLELLIGTQHYVARTTYAVQSLGAWKKADAINGVKNTDWDTAGTGKQIWYYATWDGSDPSSISSWSGPITFSALQTALTGASVQAVAVMMGVVLDGIKAGSAYVDDLEVNGTTYYGMIQDAVDAASPSDTINVAAGTYDEGIIQINKNLTIIGATTPSKPIIKPTTNTGTANAIGASGRGWFQIHGGATVDFENLVFEGTGKNIYTAVHYHADSGGGTVKNCDFTNIRHSQYQGRGINNYDQDVNVLYCTFTNIQRIGVFTYNSGATTYISGCTYTGKDTGDWLDYAFEAGNGGNITVEDCTITDCKGQVGGYISAGITATTAYGSGTTATITGCDIYNNRHGVWIGYGASDTTTATITNNNIYNNTGNGILARGTTTAHYNNIYGNGEYGAKTDYATVYDFEYNWWGDPSGPADPAGTTEVPPCTGNPATEINADGAGNNVSDNVDYCPWLATSAAAQSTGTATGSGTATFGSDVGQVGFAGAISEALLPTAGKPNINFPHGFFSFTITGVGFAGTAIVTITLPPGPTPTQYWKYHPNTQSGWVQIPMTVVSPNVIRITLQDGGLGDDDGVINGVIVDQGGPGNPGPGPAPAVVGWETYSTNKVRVLLPWIVLFTAIMAGVSLLVLRRRRAQG